jgi:hypothetical protein
MAGLPDFGNPAVGAAKRAPALVGLARGQNLWLFLLRLFDFFFLTVVAFTHDELLV